MLPVNENEVKIEITAAAFEQIRLITENDYTLDGLNFRLKIDGKGCDGFTYATGFSEVHSDDKKLIYQHKDHELTIIIDPFTLFYCMEGELDFFIRTKENQDGFIFINANEDNYHGKFFKEGEMVPTIGTNA
jgi:iron-sulfur cluster insertion protein